jgi:hypothetical protein
MRTGAALRPALVGACLSCTYDIPALETRDGSASDDGTAAFGDDAGIGAAETSGVDAGAESIAPCTGTLCECDNASSCASGVCAGQITMGATLFNAAGGMQFCTKPCCTSANCDNGTVCYGSGQGGNYCVDPKWLGRSAPGPAQGGASCSSGSDCRSGLCTAAQTCADTCCSFPGTAECAPGSQCAFGSFPGAVSLDTHFTGRCGPPGGAGASGAPCSGNGDCAGGLCYQPGTGAYCTRPCGTSDECGGGSACLPDMQGSDLYFACFPSGATGESGTSCSNNNQCRGDWCDSISQCSNVCFTNSSCPVGWRCLPVQAVVPGSGNYVILYCSP